MEERTFIESKERSCLVGKIVEINEDALSRDFNRVRCWR